MKTPEVEKKIKKEFSLMSPFNYQKTSIDLIQTLASNLATSASLTKRLINSNRVNI